MRRLLLIAYGFPPVSRVDSYGAAARARGLAKRGWEVHVLTVADPPTFLLDDSLVASLPPNVIVHRAWSLEPTRVLQALRSRPSGASTTKPEAGKAARSYTSLPQWLVRFFRSLFFPDEKVGWTPWAVRMGQDLHRDTPFDAIVSTGPSYSAHVVGRKLAAKTRLPWLAVLMDPIVGCYAFPPVTPLHAWLFRRFETQIANEARAVAIATRPWAEALAERNPTARRRVFVFSNGFNPADFDTPPPPPHDGFLVSYVGTFQLSIRPDVFLDAVALLRRDPAFARDIRIRFVSPLDPQTSEALAARGLDDLVERTGLLGHTAAIAKMREADVLLFVLGPEEESKGILTGKLPEYLAAGRMILGLAPEGVASEAIRRSGCGVVVAPDDVDGVAAALREMYELWLAGRPLVPDPRVVAQFDAERSFDRLDSVLSTLVSGRAWEGEDF